MVLKITSKIRRFLKVEANETYENMRKARTGKEEEEGKEKKDRTEQMM